MFPQTFGRIIKADMTVLLATGLLFCLQPAVSGASLRPRRAAALSLSTSSFGASLYKQLASGNHDNIVFSPISVYAALSMTLLGAGGDTERELRTALGVQEGQNVHSGLHDFMSAVTAHVDASNVTVRIADAVYYDALQVQVSDSFAASMRQYYGAGLKPFQKPNPEQAINTWVEEVTEQAIKDFLQPEAITPDTVLMLLNALYFEGLWQTPFSPRETRHSSFTTLSGEVKQVTMMSNEGGFYVKDVSQLDARVLELLFKGRRYSLFVILPHSKTGLKHLEEQLNGEILESVLTSIHSADHLEVYLPKFTVRMNKGLKEPLQALGLKSMFDSSANFTGMARATDGRNIYVSDAQHEAMMEVTESGTKAAAVTAVIYGAQSEASVFRVDHPCLFVLRDKVDGVNLFMGRLADPSQAGR